MSTYTYIYIYIYRLNWWFKQTSTYRDTHAYTYTHTFNLHINLRIHIHIHIPLDTHICIYIYIHAYTFTYACTYTCTYTLTFSYTYTYTFTHTYTRTNIHIIHMYIRARTHACMHAYYRWFLFYVYSPHIHIYTFIHIISQYIPSALMVHLIHPQNIPQPTCWVSTVGNWSTVLVPFGGRGGKSGAAAREVCAQNWGPLKVHARLFNYRYLTIAMFNAVEWCLIHVFNRLFINAIRNDSAVYHKKLFLTVLWIFLRNHGWNILDTSLQTQPCGKPKSKTSPAVTVQMNR